MARTIVRKHKVVKKQSIVIKTEMVDLSRLHKYYKNPRKGNVEKVAESLLASGQFKPIVVNVGTKTGRPDEILAGNHTFMGAQKLHWEDMLVSWVDVSDSRARVIVLADNGSSDGSTYDDSILTELLTEIKNDTGTLIGTTYTDDVLGKLVKGEEADPLSQIDRIEDAPDEMEGVADLSNYKMFESDLAYNIPALLPEMIPDKCPEPLDVWAGHELDLPRQEEDPSIWWLAQWHAGMRGVNWKQCIAQFYCVDEQTETLTKRGWVSGTELKEDDTILSMRPDGVFAWSSISSIFRKQYKGKMHRLTKNNIDALVTPNHKFPLIDGSLVPVEQLGSHDVLRTFGSQEESDVEIYSSPFVKLVGWAVTEGHYTSDCASIVITQKTGSDTESRIRQTLKLCGLNTNETKSGTNCTAFYIPAEYGKKIREVAPSRVLSMDFLLSITDYQRKLLVDTMIDADGWQSSGSKTRCYTQKDWKHTEAFITLCTLAGIPTSVSLRDWETNFGRAKCYVVNLKVEKTAHVRSVDFHGGRGDFRKGVENFATENYEGLVWCPTTEYGTFVVRRNGIVYVTGNTDDFHFDSVYLDPAKNTKKILNLKMSMSLMPNYSITGDMPVALWIYATYRSFYVARYFQEAGIEVIPDLMFGRDEEVIDLSLLGIPQNAGVVALQVQNVEREQDNIRFQGRMLKEAEDRLHFKSVIVYGHTDADKVVERANLDCKVIRVENRSARRREYLNSGSTINSQKIVKKVGRIKGSKK